MLKTKSKAYWLFLAPALIGLLLVVIVPMLLGLFYSFTDWNGLFFTKSVGFSNYVAAFRDSQVHCLKQGLNRVQRDIHPHQQLLLEENSWLKQIGRGGIDCETVRSLHLF